MKPAGFWIRVLAAIIDVIIFALVKGAINFLLMFAGIVRDLSPQEEKLIQEMAQNGATPAEIIGATLRIYSESGMFITGGLFLVAGYVVTILFISLKGGTPGKLALGLQVRDVKSGKIPTIWSAFLREVVGKAFLFPLTLGIGLVITAFTEKKRGIHDYVSGTRVVKLDDE
ncbi:MAG: RDD family protein [Bacteriovoracaceae bacterium]|nr:RDD family protein [Bacteriovoracaceae bacterium]